MLFFLLLHTLGKSSGPSHHFLTIFKVILLLKVIVNKQFSCRFVDEGLSEVSVEEEGDSSIFWPSPTFSPFLSRTDLRPVSKPQFWL